jgi:futalosine hydrolase
MNSKGRIGLISAVPFESGLLLKELKRKRRPNGAITTGVLGGRRVVHVESGIGMVNAAHAATLLIHGYTPGLIILFGIGGAYPASGLKVGDIAMAECEVYADIGVLEEDGLRGLEATGFPLLRAGRKKYFNTFPLETGIARSALRARGMPGIRPGVFLTVSQATGTKKRAMELQGKFGAICENMEGAAAAHICTRYGLPMLEMRGISNIVHGRDLRKWDKKLASENCQRAVMGLMERLG